MPVCNGKHAHSLVSVLNEVSLVGRCHQSVLCRRLVASTEPSTRTFNGNRPSNQPSERLQSRALSDRPIAVSICRRVTGASAAQLAMSGV